MQIDAVQIDAASAIKILISFAPQQTATPTLKAMEFAEHAARNEHLQMWGFRGSAPVPEPIPVEHTCALLFDWLARASKVDDQLGELDLVAELGGEPVWRNVRFYRREIEDARPAFVAWLEGHQIEAPPAGKKRRRSMQWDNERKLAERLQIGRPEWWDLPDTLFCREARKDLGLKGANKTIIRARRAIVQEETGRALSPHGTCAASRIR